MITLLLNHLWQSTLCAGLIGLLTLLFRNNGAHVRFALWFAASLKFLIPFSLFAMLGAAILPQDSQIESAPLIARVQPVMAQIQPAAEPFAVIAPDLENPSLADKGLDDLLLGIWLTGIIALLAFWAAKYARLKAVVRDAVPVAAEKGIPTRFTRAVMEPGLVGIWRPVLLLPEGIETHLSPAELDAIVAHEMCHARRRDNLTAAIHMIVQAVFWFYPPIWWIGQRLVAEREQACDQAVVEDGNDPGVYAESILKVCKFYLRSPLDCAAGVSGADLMNRVEAIMEDRFIASLGRIKKAALAGLATIAVGVPVAAGMIPSPVAFAPARTAPSPGTEVVLRHYIDAWERRRPDFGVFRFPAAQLQAQRLTRREFDDWGALKSITFRRVNAMGWDVYFVIFENGSTIWQIAPLTADGKISAMNWSVAYVRADRTKPSPGTEAALRRQIEGWEHHRPRFDAMTPQMMTRTRAQEASIQKMFDAWGALKSIAFDQVNDSGWDVYDAAFENGQGTFSIGPLTADSKVDALSYEPVFDHPGNGPSPGSEAALRRIIESLQNGSPNYDEMTPQLAAAIRINLPRLLPRIGAYGPLKSVRFKSVSPNGVNIYEVQFQRGWAECRTAPLTKERKIQTFFFYPAVLAHCCLPLKRDEEQCMYREFFGIVVALLAWDSTAAAQSTAAQTTAVQTTAQATCTLPKIADSVALDPVPGSDLMTVPVAVNGKPKQFLLDVGTGPTQLSQATVDQLSVPEDRKGEQRFQIDTFDSGYSGQFKRTGPSEIQAPIIQAGIAGSQLAARMRVRVDNFTIGRATGRNLSFVIAKDTELGKSKPYDGLLTNDFFRQYDMEVDFAGRQINYLTATKCSDPDKVVYWPHSEVAIIPISILPDGKISVQVTINGHVIEAVIDTSSPQTVMRRGIAEQMLGLRADTPQMMPDGDLLDGMGQQVYKTTFSQIAFQGVVATNVPALIETNSMIPNLHRTPELGSRARFPAETKIPALTLGVDVLGQLHLYFAFGQNVLYVTEGE